MKPLPIVVVVLLVTTAVGAGMVPPSDATGGSRAVAAVDDESSSTAQVIGEANANMTSVLPIPSSAIDRSDIRRQHADLGPAAGFDTDGTTDRLETRALERELASMGDGERESQIDAELTEIEAEVDRLKTSERTATRAFSRGETTPREFLTELAAIHRNADTLRERIDMIEQQADTPDSDVASTRRLQNIEYDLRMLEGPVRAYAVDILRAEQPSDRIMIETSDEAIALMAIDDGQYIREIHRNELRGQEPGQMTADRAVELVQQQYPIIWDRGTSWSSDGPGSVIMVDVEFDSGDLRAFMDGSTERTFIEHQQLSLDSVGTSETTAKAQDGLNVTVEQTYAGGPLSVTVTDVSTGEPVDATVTVGRQGEESETVGTTNEAGQLWTLTPRSPFTITILGEDTSAAFVEVTPLPPEAVLTGQ